MAGTTAFNKGAGVLPSPYFEPLNFIFISLLHILHSENLLNIMKALSTSQSHAAHLVAESILTIYLQIIFLL